MKKKLFFIAAITMIFFGCATSRQSAQNGLPPYIPENRGLHDTIAMMDSILFEAYNTCKLEKFASMVDEDLEFYHDRGGLTTSKPSLIESLKNNICGKVTRELLAGSIEVYPIPGYGAVQLGAHRFYNNQEKERGPSRFSRFIHTWHLENGQWRIARVISLH